MADGETPTDGTGPDHAAGGRKYLAIEASARDAGESAKLETTVVPASCKYSCIISQYFNVAAAVAAAAVVVACSSM